MATIVAREGRNRQRYEGNHRLVSGCIPYRVRREIEVGSSIEDCIEVLMISSPNRHDLVFPKGGWDNDESVHEAACREALEEAGVRGNLNKTELGVWEFITKRKQCCRGYMFALEVIDELDTWPEQEIHTRRWLSINEATRLCRYGWLREALKEFLKLMEREKTLKMNNQQEVMDSNVTSLNIMAGSHVATSPSNICAQITMLLSLH